MENIKTFEEFHEVNEGVNLKDYLGSEYKNYEYGDPDKAALALMKVLSKFKADVQRNLDKAGSYLSPGMKVAFEKETMRVLREIQAK